MTADILPPNASGSSLSDDIKFTPVHTVGLQEDEHFLTGVMPSYECGDVKYLTFFHSFFKLTYQLQPSKKLLLPQIQTLQHRFSKTTHMKVPSNGDPLTSAG